MRDNWKDFELDKDLSLELSEEVHKFFQEKDVKEFMDKTREQRKGAQDIEKIATKTDWVDTSE